MQQQLARDERMRHLQRLAYGAVASDAERAAAVAELETLRRECDVTEPSVEVPPPGPPVGSGSMPIPASPAWSADASGAEAARPLKWAITVGTAALLIGVAVGWHFGTRMPTAAPMDQALGASASPSTVTPAQPGAAVLDSAAYGVFDRPSSPADTLLAEIPDDWVDPTSLRLLATTPEGPAVYGAKALRDSGSDVCLIIVMPSLSVGASCTVNGLFEEGRLRADHYLEGEGLTAATWHADGSVHIGSRNLTVPVE